MAGIAHKAVVAPTDARVLRQAPVLILRLLFLQCVNEVRNQTLHDDDDDYKNKKKKNTEMALSLFFWLKIKIVFNVL